MQQQIDEILQNSQHHTQLLNNIIKLISGTRLSTQQKQQEVRQQGQPPQDPASLPSVEEIVELKNASSSPMNFSVKLVNRLFIEDELCNRNVHGGHGRLALNPSKLAIVKEIYFQVFPTENELIEWQKCVNSINAHLRKYHKKKQ